MREFIGFSITGTTADKLAETLQHIGDDMKYKTGRFAGRKAAQVIAKQVVDNAKLLDDPETPSKIYANVKEKWSRKQFNASGDLAFRIGILGGAGGNATSQELSINPGLDTRYWRHVEFGTMHNPARPFFRKALNESANAATKAFIDNYQKAIDRAIKRTGGTN